MALTNSIIALAGVSVGTPCHLLAIGAEKVTSCTLKEYCTSHMFEDFHASSVIRQEWRI